MPPFGSGLLVLTAPLAALPRRAAAAVAAAARVVAGPLYVHLQPGLRLAAPAEPLPAAPPACPALLRALAALYAAAAAQRDLDLRVLLGPRCRRLSRPPRVLLAAAAEAPGPPGPVQLGLQHLAAAAYGCPPHLPAVLLGDPGDGAGDPEEDAQDTGAALPGFSDVVVGGTFDRLHGAHRLLLSACCLLARQRLLAGVSDGDLLRRESRGDRHRAGPGGAGGDKDRAVTGASDVLGLGSRAPKAPEQGDGGPGVPSTPVTEVRRHGAAGAKGAGRGSLPKSQMGFCLHLSVSLSAATLGAQGC